MIKVQLGQVTIGIEVARMTPVTYGTIISSVLTTDSGVATADSGLITADRGVPEAGSDDGVATYLLLRII